MERELGVSLGHKKDLIKQEVLFHAVKITFRLSSTEGQYITYEFCTCCVQKLQVSAFLDKHEGGEEGQEEQEERK